MAPIDHPAPGAADPPVVGPAPRPQPHAGRPAPRAAERRSAFRRVFNLPHLAALSGMTLLLVLCTQGFFRFTSHPPWEAIRWIGYLVRQFMITGALMLLAMAVGEALWVRHAGTLRPLAGRVALLAGAFLASAAIRLQTAARPMPADELLPWLLPQAAMWITLGLLGWSAMAAMARRDQARDALRQVEVERQRQATEALEARVSALQAQIEPHFLFNTLANVRRLYDTDVAAGERMLAGLIDYLRSALPAMRAGDSTLGRELELARSLLTVLQLRMGERMRFTIDADGAPADQPMPPMVLPTLVENAVKHGLQPLPEGGSIAIRVRRGADDIAIEVADDGCGFTGTAGNGVGLANTRARLAALYGGRARFALRANRPRGVVAEIRVPRDPALWRRREAGLRVLPGAAA